VSYKISHRHLPRWFFAIAGKVVKDMRTPAQIAGHPIHPMLVTIPIGLWVFSFVCDLVAKQSSTPENWSMVALYSMVGGIIGGLAAAIPGLIDLLSLQDKGIKKTALTHMGLNLVIVALYAINAWTRSKGLVSANVSLGLSVLAIAMLLVSGWLGGKMVYEAGVAVHATEAAEAPRTGSWESNRAASPSRRASPGFGGERAMASDSGGPGTGREGSSAATRPSAGERSRE
jgi:uncharacterized membrane protein